MMAEWVPGVLGKTILKQVRKFNGGHFRRLKDVSAKLLIP
jgi:hypothetical protein